MNTFNTNKEIAKCIYEYLKRDYKNESWLVYVLNYDKSHSAIWSKKGNYVYISLTFMKIGQKYRVVILKVEDDNKILIDKSYTAVSTPCKSIKTIEDNSEIMKTLVLSIAESYCFNSKIDILNSQDWLKANASKYDLYEYWQVCKFSEGAVYGDYFRNYAAFQYQDLVYLFIC